MEFDNVQMIFYQCIPRRYHRFSRELFNQLLCLNLTIKPAYLFDLFPLSIKAMRLLLTSLSPHLSFSSILLKYSLNDLIIINRSQLSNLIESSVLVIDLTTKTASDTHPIRDHLRWIAHQEHDRIDFDDEIDEDWSNLIQPLNHTSVFGYLLGYPLVYFYSLTTIINVNSLLNYRLYVNIPDEMLLYSFSSPIDENLDQTQIEAQVNRWYSTLALQMNSMNKIKQYHLDKQTREESAWCL